MERIQPPALQALVLACAFGLLGLVVNAARTDGIPLDRPVLAAAGGDAFCVAPVAEVLEIDVNEARLLHEAGAFFVDARPSSQYATGHVPGALHLPSRGECPDADEVVSRLREAQVVVVYDNDAACALARPLGDRLLAQGLADVRVLSGGFRGWQGAGEPAQSGSCEACGEEARR